MSAEQRDLFLALLEVYKMVGSVGKTGRNDHQRYDYASEVDILHAVRPAMAECGLTMHCAAITDIQCGQVTGGQGKPKNQYNATYHYQVTHAETGQYLTVLAAGSGEDVGDKAPYKAATGASKYALRQLLMLICGDDPDADGSNNAPPPAEKDHAAEALRVIFDGADVERAKKAAEFLQANEPGIYAGIAESIHKKTGSA